MSAFKEYRSNWEEITAAKLGITVEKLREHTENAKSRITKSGNNPEAVRDFHEHLARYAKAKDKREQTFIHIQSALKSIFANVIKIHCDEMGGKVFIRIREENTATVTSLDWAVNYAAKRIEEYGIFLSNKALTEHVITWSDKVDSIESMPTSFSIDPNELTFNRIKLELREGPTPTWDYFIGKCGSNGRALMAYIWSLLEKEDKSQQYGFVKGGGKDGKGSLTRWLDKLFNEQLVGLSAKNQYWPAQCIGKRIGIFSDLNNTSVVMSSDFKQITGGDKISIEQKYLKAVSLTLDTKFILTTNRSINIIGDEAERRRAILVEITSDDTIIEDYEEKLWSERHAFLFKCKMAYGELYDPKTKKVKCDYSFFESESASYEEQYESLFDTCFILDTKSTISGADFYNRVCRETGRDNNKVSALKEWLERTHQIKRSKNTSSKKSEYKGLRIKS